jgi:eukaryotic-like serine/threonine-protein kinase
MSHSHSEEDRHPVEVIAEEYSTRLRAGEKPTIEEYAHRFPEHAELLRTILPSIALVERVSNEDSAQPKSSTSHLVSPIASSRPSSLGDYEIVREIGRGGMGVVYEAIQRSLNRHVALKVISGLISGNAKHSARFRREAESAASLHHTNIVPIYGIGEDQGLQYYAMQLIDGVTLHDVIECLRNDTIGTTHSGEAARRMLSKSTTETMASVTNATSTANASARAASQLKAAPREAETIELTAASPDETTMVAPIDSNQPPATETEQGATSQRLTREYFRNVARTIANVANALHYAHHQRVLHRDIKPANLLLDREGTIWVTDFGLARRTDLDAETQTGEILGTLRYMAPEQIAGSGDSRVDIYSLGLTLFELLTLKPAIESPKSRLLDPERNSILRSPRSIQPNIPADLQTITLKACAYDAKDRYQHAREFEEDLRRFLEDRPILAKRSTRTELLMRWARRNPAIATLTAATLCLLILIAGLLGIWNRQQQRSIGEIGKQFERAETNLAEKTQALAQVEQEQTRAEKNLSLALKAFDQITSNIASRGSMIAMSGDFDDDESVEFANATLSQADVALLESLLEFFDAFSQENAKDLRIEAAVGQQRVADIQHKLGQLDKAEESYQKALNAFRAILEQKPDLAESVLPMLAIHTERLTIFAKRGQLLKAEGEYKEALSLLNRSPQVKQTADGRFAMAKLLNCIGTLQTRFGGIARQRGNRPLEKLLAGPDLPPEIAMRIKRDAEFNAEALTLLKGLTTESPDNVSYQVVLGRALRDESRIARDLRDFQRSDDAIRKSIELFEALCKSHSDSAAFKYELAETLSRNVSNRPIDRQRCERARTICDQIVKEHPQVPEYQALKASTLFKLSMAEGKSERAEELMQETIAIQRELASRFTDVAVYGNVLRLSLLRLSEIQEHLGKSEKAKETKEFAEKELLRLKENVKLPKSIGPFRDMPRDRPFMDRRNKL